MSEDVAAESPQPAKKRKKKRKAKAERDGVPAFARSFPRHPQLDALLAAFEQGDYATVRREAPKLARSTGDDAPGDDVRRAAKELLRRIEPDRLAILLLSLPVLLLGFLTVWYYLHAHAPR